MVLDVAETATRIHADLPVVDGHNDLAWALRIRAGGNLETADPCGPLDGYHTDSRRLVRGGVGAQFWSVYIPASNSSPFQSTLEQIDLVRSFIQRCAQLEEADTAASVAAIRGRGHTASLLGAEGGHCIENSLDALRRLRHLGVRYLTLTHADTNDWADSATDEARHGGLTGFGEEVVREMNRIGMIVDISHVSPDTMRHALAVSERPVMASHSGALAVASHPRNVPDDVLELVADNGGVVMVNFYPAFVTEAASVHGGERLGLARELQRRLGDDAAVEAELARLLAEDPYPVVTVADVVDHIEHIAGVAGVEHVGLGSDFDGIDATPVGLEDVSTYPAITADLLRRGWDEAAIRQVLGENALRVLAENDVPFPPPVS
ncbi:MAG: dipeptidase [Acidimicrobiia bacterium]|nr:MAG: dipeptidase [Acidimicrobiia bacterium]